MSHLAITDADRDAAGRIIVERAASPTERTLSDLLPAASGEAAASILPTIRWSFTRTELISMACAVIMLVIFVAFEVTRPAPSATTRSVSTAPPLPQPTAAPTLTPTPPQQDAYAAPNGALLGTIPQTVTLVYQHSRYPGWGGVEWEGGIVWIQTTADVATLPDLAPPTLRPAPQLPSAPASAPQAAPAVAPDAPPAPAEPGCDPQVNPRYTSPLRVDPIGSVTGVSCVSQGDADANAVLLAEQLRASVATADAADDVPPPAGPGQAAPSAR